MPDNAIVAALVLFASPRSGYSFRPTHRALSLRGCGLHIDEDPWQFGPFLVDRRRRLLLAAGRPVKLDARAFDVLEYLVGRRDESPSRDEILAHVWRGTTVSENNLSVQLSALRRALLDHGGGDKLILTLPGRRYRFVGDVHAPEAIAAVEKPLAPAGPPPGPTTQARSKPAFPRRTVAGLLAASLLIGAAWLMRSAGPAGSRSESGLSIVVLPFRNLRDASQNYLADAVTDDLTTELARLPHSVVIARETAETYASRRMQAHDIGRALNVSYLLEGGVSPDETTLQINARLIDTQTDAEIWAKHFAVPRDRMGDARDLLVSRIVATLGPVFVQAESTRSRQDRPENPGAVDFLLRARSIMDLGDTLADYQAAQKLLERAIAQQPAFEEALAELGWLLMCKLTNVDDPDELKDEARAGQVIEQALRLAPRNARALNALGKQLSLNGDYAGAIASVNEALLIQPNDVEALWVLGTTEYYLGHLEKAALPIEASLRIDPEGPSSKRRYLRLGSVKLFEARYDDAASCLQKALAGEVMPQAGEGQWSRVELGRLMLIATLALAGRLDEARTMYSSYSTSWPHRSTWRVAALAPKTLRLLPGFQRFLDALESAGMPRYAEESTDDHLPVSASPLTGGIFKPTPLTVPNAITVNTNALTALLHSGRPVLLLDLGTGTAVADGAIWADRVVRGTGDNAFVAERASAFLKQSPSAPIVVMADGTYGITAYNAALYLASLTSLGRTQVYFYRGGEEAWAKAGFTGQYRRSD